jgi:hydroxymethylbilane synthase
MRKIIIGSRGSDLALWQANHVKRQLEDTGAEVSIKIIKTQGDQIHHLSLDKLEGKGFFTKELEEELLAGTIDLAVHSHKDLPTTSPEGLMIAAVSEREDPSELILINKNAVDITLKFHFKKNSIIGSSSARRKSQLLSFRDDIEIKDIRGNVPTRVQKLRDGQYDAIMIAKAGVERLQLDLSDLYVTEVSPLEIVPAPAQGVLALQIREKDSSLFEFLQKINHPDIAEEISVERKVLNLFDGGCHLPLGVFCKKYNDEFLVWSAKAEEWNTFPKRHFIKAKSVKGLAESIVAKIKDQSIKSKEVFITRDVDADSYLSKSLSAFGANLTGVSLIEVRGQRSEVGSLKSEETHNLYSDLRLPTSDFIFFPSKQAVKYFFENKPSLNSDIKFGVYGRGTEAALNKFGYKADFVGESSDSTEVSEQLKKIVSGKKVLIPQAKDSLRTIENSIKDICEVHPLIVYETLPKKNVMIPDTDMMIFSSPSNVESFFAQHKLKSQVVIAIGTSTATQLQRFGVNDIKIANTSDEVGLAEVIFAL